MVLKKSPLYNSKCSNDVNEVDIKKILTSDRISFGKKGFKYFIGYQDNDKIKPLCIMLPKITGYVKCFDETNYI